MRFITKCAKETFALGKRIGQLLYEGDIIALDGDLGSGKTQMVKGIARGLGITDEITSPTYTIMSQHNGRLPLYHFDVYRLEDPEQLYDIGYEEYFFDKGITVIEWSEKIRGLLPAQYMHIRILYGTDENQRIIDVEAIGPRYVEILKGLNEY
ncbi:MAG: tRNA threonylcarbamoyladenosine biosynthesis protein TsaE [Clostridiales bacterium]|nr:tRNA threonylcarbamoyladenosine biosynthesis protein TsaE [Clostridiales bacterium]